MYPVKMTDPLEYDAELVRTKKLKYISIECPICAAGKLEYCYTGMVHVARKEARWKLQEERRARKEALNKEKSAREEAHGKELRRRAALAEKDRAEGRKFAKEVSMKGTSDTLLEDSCKPRKSTKKPRKNMPVTVRDPAKKRVKK